MHERRLFLIQDPEDNLGFPRAVSNIAAAEYYIDTDPGVGNGTAITITGGATITENFNIATDALSPGYHILGVRAQNEEGRWGMHERRLFLIQDPSDELLTGTLFKIVELEYFIDEDPGEGNGVNVPVDVPLELVEIADLMVDTDGIALGTHQFFIRAKDEVGTWGLLDSATFEVANSLSEVDSLALVEFYTSLDGSNWTDNTNWLVTNQNVETWFGITLNPEGLKVEEINLPANGLSGTIPIELDELNALQVLDLSDNSIEALETDFSTLTNVTSIDLSGNNLDFGDLEPIAGISVLDYSNQENLENAIDQNDLVVRAGTDQTLTTTAVAGSSNLYQWTLNGTNIDGAEESSYTIENMNPSKVGQYGVAVSNSVVTGLTLESPDIEVLGNAVITVSAVDNETPITDDINAYLFSLNEAVADTVNFAGNPNISVSSESYSFPEVLFGDYLVGVESVNPFLDNEDFQIPGAYIPTFFGDEYLSSESDILVLQSDTTIFINVEIIPTISLGDGLVSGIVDEDFGDDEGRIDARRRAKKRKCGLRRRRTGGRTGQDDNDQFELISYGETNDNGEFEFGFLPQGTYRFFVEYPGIPLDESAYVEFEIGEAGVTDTDFTLAVFASPDGIEIEIVLGVTTDYFVDFSIYPNPTTNIINVEYDQIKLENVKMQIATMEGKIVYTRKLDRSQKKIIYDTSLLKPGQYFVRFIGGGNQEPLVYKIIKK